MTRALPGQRKCWSCAHAWFPRIAAPPKRCPRCQQPYVKPKRKLAAAKK